MRIRETTVYTIRWLNWTKPIQPSENWQFILKWPNKFKWPNKLKSYWCGYIACTIWNTLWKVFCTVCRYKLFLMYWVRIQLHVHANVIDLFSLYVLFSQDRSFDDTLENCFFQILSYSRAYLCVMYEMTKGKVPLGPLLGKQNIQVKEVYTFQRCIDTLQSTFMSLLGCLDAYWDNSQSCKISYSQYFKKYLQNYQ